MSFNCNFSVTKKLIKVGSLKRLPLSCRSQRIFLYSVDFLHFKTFSQQLKKFPDYSKSRNVKRHESSFDRHESFMLEKLLIAD